MAVESNVTTGRYDLHLNLQPETIMGAQKGKDLLIRLDDGTGGFATVAGLRARQISFNAETVDVTNADSAGRWRELLEGAGVRRASLSGSGVFKDESSDSRVRQVFFEGTIEPIQVVVPEFGLIGGPFQITALEYRGDHAGEITFDMTLESAGALTFTPA
jgi:TP901-1 family phage major tail protein